MTCFSEVDPGEETSITKDVPFAQLQSMRHQIHKVALNAHSMSAERRHAAHSLD
jgi:hypothetical protein